MPAAEWAGLDNGYYVKKVSNVTVLSDHAVLVLAALAKWPDRIRMFRSISSETGLSHEDVTRAAHELKAEALAFDRAAPFNGTGYTITAKGLAVHAALNSPMFHGRLLR